jgi:hypothetical protein
MWLHYLLESTKSTDSMQYDSADSLMSNSKNVTILWNLPSKKLDRDGTVFSFLSPLLEHNFISTADVKEVITMSRAMDQVSVEARALYVEIVADIGLFELPDGRTLRAALAGIGETSHWWYHPVSFRNSENTPTYTNILSVLAIAQEASRRGVDELHLVRPPEGVADVLKSSYKVTVERLHCRPGWFDIGRGFLGRIRFLYRTIVTKLALVFYYSFNHIEIDIAFQGFWDWSVFFDPTLPGHLSDNYFGKLPFELRKRGKIISYWGWYDPRNKPGVNKRSHKEALRPLQGHNDVLLLQSLLKLKEIIVIGFDFSVLPIIVSALRLRSFKDVFKRRGLNFYPLFYISLIRGSICNGIPQCRFFELAAKRAQSITQPKITVRFQEHNPPSRAIYAAMKGTKTSTWAIQHCGYSSGKTYLALHSSKEFAPQFDLQAVPVPDRMCVMGKLGERLFGDCGYDSKQIILSGSPRYDHVKLMSETNNPNALLTTSHNYTNILIASSLPARAELMMVEAVVESIQETHDNFSLRLRQHPYDRMESLPGFCELELWLDLSKNTLADDLAWADLVIIGQSTVGEEAFFKGKQVWQFRFPHPDQSALAEVSAMPRFYSIMELRSALKEVKSFGLSNQPDMKKVKMVYQELFQTIDRKPSDLITDLMCAEL